MHVDRPIEGLERRAPDQIHQGVARQDAPRVLQVRVGQPHVTLAIESDTVQLQDHVTVFGYPGAADTFDSGILDRKSALEAIGATVLANAVDSPLKRGGCTGRCFGDEGGMYDFLDIDIDPRTGQLWAALVDVCSGDCDGPGKTKADVYEKAVGVVARMGSGTPLLTEPIPARG